MTSLRKTAPVGRKKQVKSVSYAKWGYIFLIPFFVAFILFTLIPLCRTFYYSLFEYYRSGLKVVGPNFRWFQNYVEVFAKADLAKYLWNTVFLWLLCFIPQIIVSLLLAVWFTDTKLRIKGQGFFKTVIYMPNLIMASAFAMLFFVLFSDGGPICTMLRNMGVEFSFLRTVVGTRGLIALMNFLMWFGNTTIVLMAAVMGIDTSLFEAADIDGASASKTFFHVTLPMIRPVMSYTLITSLIGGLQLFDVPQVLTNAAGNPNRTSFTIIMLLNNYISKSKNYGYGGALSVTLFILTAALGMIVYWSLNTDEREANKLRKQQIALAKQKGGALK